MKPTNKGSDFEPKRKHEKQKHEKQKNHRQEKM